MNTSNETMNASNVSMNTSNETMNASNVSMNASNETDDALPGTPHLFQESFWM